MLTADSPGMATFECDNSLAAEEEMTIDIRDRIRLLTAALGTQLVRRATSGSLYRRDEQAVDRTVNLFQKPI
jgi:hypothetical protein